MMVHDSDHVCNIRHPAGMHRWDEETAKLKSRKGNMRSKRWWCPAVVNE